VQGRETLLRAARELMVERGFPRVTVRDVAKRAGVGPALVNYYFGGKSGLFAAIIEQVALDIRERLERAKQQSGPITERIRGFVREFVDAMAADPYLPRLLAEQVLFADEEVIDRFARELAAPNLAEIRNLLTEGIASGELRDVDPKFVVPSMIGACLYFFLAARLVCRLFDLEKITPALADDFAKSTADLILQGLLLRTSTT
jgi:AcrR family transcriptional regulator